jgi:hypothetical protein
MTLEEKKKCSEIWKMASEDYIRPEDWTDSAGDALAKYLAGIYHCSDAMSYVPQPVGSRPGWGWVVSEVYNVLKNKYGMDKGQVFVICSDVSLSRYRSIIPSECLK